MEIELDNLKPDLDARLKERGIAQEAYANGWDEIEYSDEMGWGWVYPVLDPEAKRVCVTPSYSNVAVRWKQYDTNYYVGEYLWASGRPGYSSYCVPGFEAS